MRLLAAAVSIVVALCGAPTASGAPAAPSLILRGSRTATAGLTLTAPTTFQAGGFDPARAMRASMKGSYAGFLLQAPDGRVVVGAVVVRGFDLDGGPVPLVFGQGFEAVRVPAGRYRLTLLTDGRAQVTIPAPGLRRSKVLAPSSPSASRAQMITSPLPGVVPVSHLRGALRVGPRTTTLLASVQSYATSAGLAYDMCLASRGALCQTGSVGGGSGVALTDATATTSITAMYFYPGEISPSAYDAVFTTAGAGVPDRVRAFALSIG